MEVLPKELVLSLGSTGPAEFNEEAAANAIAAHQKALAGALIYSNVAIKATMTHQPAREVENKIERLDLAALQLQELEDELLQKLPAPAQAAYLSLDGELYQLLLGDQGAKLPDDQAAQALARLVQAQQALLTATPALAPLAPARWQLLQQLECIGSNWKTVENPPAAGQLAATLNRFKWKRYLASRRLRYLTRLEARWLATDWPLNAANILSTLENGPDLQLGLEAYTFEAAPAPEEPEYDFASAPGDLDAAPGGADFTPADDYAEAVRQLEQATAAKARAAALLTIKDGSLNRGSDLRQFKADYDKLSRDEAAYAYLVKEKRKTRGDFTNLYDDYLKGSTSQALKDGFKVLWSTVGQATKRALLSDEKVDSDELARDIYKGLFVTGVTIVSTMYLGPLGSIISGQLMGAFFPQPDPLKQGLDQLQKSMKADFAKVQARFDQMDTQFRNLDKHITEHLQSTTEYTDERSKLQNAEQLVLSAIAEVEKLMTLVDTQYEELFDHGNSGDSFVSDLLTIDVKLRADMTAVLRQFYHSSFSLDKLLAPGTPPTADSLADKFIQFYLRKPPFFRPFHVVGAELQLYCARLQLLTHRYFATRQKIELALGAAAVFGGKLSKPRQHIFGTLSEMHRGELEERSRYFAGVFSLEQNVIGSNNLVLLREFQAYSQDVAKFSMRAGFGLGVAPSGPAKTATPATQQREWAVPAGKPTGPLWLAEADWSGAPARYYVLPPGGTPPGVTIPANTPGYLHPYTLCTWQNYELPQWLQAHIALDVHDGLRLYPVASEGKAAFAGHLSARTLALAVAPAFADSLERLLLVPLPLAELAARPRALHLPRRGCQLELTAAPASSPTPTSAWALTARIIEAGKAGDVLVQAASCPQATAVQGVLTPEHVGLALVPGTSPGAPTVSLNRRSWPVDAVPQLYGVWSATMAFGPNDVPTERPFRYMLYPEERTAINRPQSLSLHSPGGSHWVQARLHLNYDWLLELHSAQGRLGSLFDNYTYRQNDYAVDAKMQADGNLVLYDGHDHAVAATHSHNSPDTALFLTDHGQLQLRALYEAAAPVKKTLAVFPETKFTRESMNWEHKSKFNRLLPGQVLSIYSRLTSVGNDFEVWLESTPRTVRCGFLWLDQEVRHETKLIKRRNGNDVHTWRHEVVYEPSLKSWGSDYGSHTNVDLGVYSWVDSVDRVTIHTALLLGRNQIPTGAQSIQLLSLAKLDHPSDDCFLCLDANGDLLLCAASTGAVLHKV